MNRMKNIFLTGLALLTAVSCVQPKVSVDASFTTDKDVYEVYENVVLTNTSTATNDIIVACKWDWGTGYKWGKQLTDPISFDTVGEKEITLTAVTNGNVSGSFTKTITVQDTNVRPVAEFTWTPAEGIVAGDEVQFNDQSSDADGQIVSWEWRIGSNVVTEQNPRFTFNESGDIEVTLTVTDNQRGKGSVTKTLHVDKNKDSMELLWSTSYDSAGDVIFTSPAVSPDGNTVYVYSTGLHLAAIGKDGTQKWSFDAGTHNPGTTVNFVSCTPSVDADGTVFLIVGNKDTQDKTGATQSGIYAINPDGTQKWYYGYGYGYFINVVPLVLQNQICVATKRNPSPGDFPDLWPEGKGDNGLLINKADGSYFDYLQVKRGSHGGIAATKDETIAIHTDSKYGTRVYWKEGDKWNYYGAAAGQDAFMLGFVPGSKNTAIGYTSYMSIDDNNRIYILYGKNSGGSTESEAVLYCYDLTKYNTTEGATPEWTLDLDGNNRMNYGLGTVLGEDGTIYVTTTTGVTAVNPDGTKKWYAAAGNEVLGSPAVDKGDYVYYTETDSDRTAGKLVKLNAGGTKVAELTLGESVCTSPTIAPDGTIYCNGIKDGKPTLSAIGGVAEPASGWSQFGGNPRKTCKAE